jgi:hypothetical protein
MTKSESRNSRADGGEDLSGVFLRAAFIMVGWSLLIRPVGFVSGF